MKVKILKRMDVCVFMVFTFMIDISHLSVQHNHRPGPKSSPSWWLMAGFLSCLFTVLLDVVLHGFFFFFFLRFTYLF